MLSSMNRGSGAHCIELTTKAGGFVLNSAHVTVYDVLFTLGPARIGQPQFRRLAGHQRKRGGQRGGSEDQFYVAAWRPEVLNLLTYCGRKRISTLRIGSRRGALFHHTRFLVGGLSSDWIPASLSGVFPVVILNHSHPYFS